MKPPQKDVERDFWAYVDKAAGPSACWPWTGRRDPRGYGAGVFWVLPEKGRGRQYRAHRLAWRFAPGTERQLRADLCVRHKCDNPPCCNPRHLEAGTQKENMADMQRRRRSTRGRTMPVHRRSRHGLTPEQVLDIRRRWREGRSQHELAREHGVSRSLIQRIVSGGPAWSWLKDDGGGDAL